MHILADQFFQIKSGFGVANLVAWFQRITPAAEGQGQVLITDDPACLDEAKLYPNNSSPVLNRQERPQLGRCSTDLPNTPHLNPGDFNGRACFRPEADVNSASTA